MVLATTSDVCVRGTHPCKVRKDGAPSFVVIPAKTKGGPPGNGTITYLCNAPYIAVRGDGAVVVTEATNVGLPSVTLNGQMYSIPPSTVTNYGNTIDVLCCVGPPMVNSDGTAYLEYEVRNTVNNVVTSDTLYLMQINPDNSSSSTILSATTQNETQYPGNIIPDGNGGVLATWSVSVVQGTQPTYPYEAVDFNSGAVGTPYYLPFSPQSVNIAQQPDLVLGENGVAFASGMTTATVNGTPTQVSQIASFNIGSGASNWTYQAPAGDTLTIVEATGDGGITINDSNSGILQLDATGENSGSDATRRNGSLGMRPDDTSTLQGAVPFDLSTWVSAASGVVNAILSPNGSNGVPTILAQSVYPMPHGNQQGQSTTPFCQRKNVQCALAPHSDGLSLYGGGTLVRQVEYQLFSLQNGTLTPLYGSPQIQGVKIEEWEANPSNPSVHICSWQNQDTKCESPNSVDPPGQYTDDMGAGVSSPYTVQQQFLADRQGLQVFWPNPAPVWYGAWGTPASAPAGFQPNQTASTTNGWATISQINVNIKAPTACPSGCDTTPAQAGPPTQ